MITEISIFILIGRIKWCFLHCIVLYGLHPLQSLSNIWKGISQCFTYSANNWNAAFGERTNLTSILLFSHSVLLNSSTLCVFLLFCISPLHLFPWLLTISLLFHAFYSLFLSAFRSFWFRPSDFVSSILTNYSFSSFCFNSNCFSIHYLLKFIILSCVFNFTWVF